MQWRECDESYALYWMEAGADAVDRNAQTDTRER